MMRHPQGGEEAELIRVRGLVQGVGLRPAIWRLAHRYGLRGWVGNDGAGVTIAVSGAGDDIAGFVADLRREPPPLARIDAIMRTKAPIGPDDGEFHILPSRADAVRTGVVPDAATCAACRREIGEPSTRRYRYPFTNCTHCGPRQSIIEAVPYDRISTTMRAFQMCPDCRAEYADPADRRYHAQPIACPQCGPRVWLEPGAAGETVDAARRLLVSGHIIALKALGGFHLACDATSATAVARLRRAKRRDAKPFALMARDLAVIRRFAAVTETAAAALQSSAAPIVVMDATAPGALADVAPGLATLGFMLPSTPLHHLLLEEIDRPLVMTSGNISDEPQCTDNGEALRRLKGVAEYFLLHDRPIACRVDDSIVRVMAGDGRVLRRARGYAPAPLLLPDGFADAMPILAMGAELKSTFCLLRDGEAVLSHHIGDLENAPTFADYRRSIGRYCELFAFRAAAVAVDGHPEYLSTKHGGELAEGDGVPLVEVQHHHAHLAACMAENGVPLDGGPVLGIILDGLGWGSDGTIWGGEFLLGDYRGVHRVARFKPVAMPGGAQAIREPWRSALAHILAAMGWPQFTAAYGESEFGHYLMEKPVRAVASMIDRGVNAPLASSCGRLFDAVAAAVGLCRDRARYEGQAAMLLEAVAEDDGAAYPFAIGELDGMVHLDPAPLWAALLDDLARRHPRAAVAGRFHAGLADAIVAVVAALGIGAPVALSGGVFQNRLLFERVVRQLTACGLRVITHRNVPANDGGVSLGQAVVAAARLTAGATQGSA
jgi:hydrogenase maturation protein HypF